MANEKWYERFKDDAFIRYYESGEASAVHVVRDLAEEVDTRGMWIDVLGMNTFNHSKYNKKGINWIVAELFPRITNPQYTEDKEYNRYLCWHAAHNDIAQHHIDGFVGEKYLVLCRLSHVEDEEENEYEGYEVTASQKVNKRQIKWIETHSDLIIYRIRKKGKATLLMFEPE